VLKYTDYEMQRNRLAARLCLDALWEIMALFTYSSWIIGEPFQSSRVAERKGREVWQANTRRDKQGYALCALILLTLRRYINHLLTYLLTYLYTQQFHRSSCA